MRNSFLAKANFFVFCLILYFNSIASFCQAQNDTTELLNNQAASFEDKTWNELLAFQKNNSHSFELKTSRLPLLRDLKKSFKIMFEKSPVEILNINHLQKKVEYTETGLLVTVQVDENFLRHPELGLKDLSLLLLLAGNDSLGIDNSAINVFFETPQIWAETFVNSEMGSPISASRLKTLELAVMKSPVPRSIIKDFMQNLGVQASEAAQAEIPREIERLEREEKELTQAAAEYAKFNKKEWSRWRAETLSLEKYEAMDEKLNDLVLKNDRKAVRKMLEAYLPWTLMEPIEYQTWKIWLDAIENPDLSRQTVAFRGVNYNTDKVQKIVNSDGTERLAFLSTVLTKNQGSYTRRLRSLTTNRESNGDRLRNVFPDNPSSVRIVDQMLSHSLKPLASNFLSFSFDPNICVNFVGKPSKKIIRGKTQMVAGGGLLAVKMDSRRLVPNIVSRFGNEVELLAPLIVFPDEVLAFQEGPFQGWSDGVNGYERMKAFIRSIYSEAPDVAVRWAMTGKREDEPEMKTKFILEAFNFLRNISTTPMNRKLFCSGVFLN